ncbi:hypothetical protein H6G97_11015 [Nostoc flagelliforme FACHB-838]|uniref:Transposase n=1 Tax=Nostoc flagelliforme FACHB-838 TaxID=2692904 RepID=A0ABR8DPH1_9NOSO|nr:hypothetical protein [Nostoc flagelliforme FACHB-838]
MNTAHCNCPLEWLHLDRKDAINCRLYNNQFFVETAIYRVLTLRSRSCHQPAYSPKLGIADN